MTKITIFSICNIIITVVLVIIILRVLLLLQMRANPDGKYRERYFVSKFVSTNTIKTYQSMQPSPTIPLLGMTLSLRVCLSNLVNLAWISQVCEFSAQIFVRSKDARTGYGRR